LGAPDRAPVRHTGAIANPRDALGHRWVRAFPSRLTTAHPGAPNCPIWVDLTM
jgi:hypothetical protein